jgi:hypothetical protein
MSPTFKEEYLDNPDEIETFIKNIKGPTVLVIGEAEETYLIIPKKDIAIILYHYPHDAKLLTLEELKEHVLQT